MNKSEDELADLRAKLAEQTERAEKAEARLRIADSAIRAMALRRDEFERERGAAQAEAAGYKKLLAEKGRDDVTKD